MIRALLALLLLALSQSASAAYAYVQQVQDSDDVAGTSITVALTTTGANAVVCWGTYHNAAGTQAVTFTRTGDTFAAAANAYSATSDTGISLAYIQNVAASSNIVTATFGSSSTVRGIWCTEMSGLATSGIFGAGEAVAACQDLPGTGADAVTAGNITAAQQPAAVISLASTYVTAFGNLTEEAGLTERGAGGWDFNFGVGQAAIQVDKRITATGSTNARYTLTSNDYTCSATIVLREPAAASGLLLRRRRE